MKKKQEQNTKTCADCIHEFACRMWTDGRPISDSSASLCPNYTTVKDSGAYLCGVLDERKRKQNTYPLEEIAQKICDSYEECTEGVCPGFAYCNRHLKKNGVLEWLKTILKSEPNT